MTKKLLIACLLVALAAVPARAAQLDEQRALQFIEQCRNTPDRQPNLSLIYWKLKVWEAAETQFDAAPYAAPVQALQNEDGGFGLWPKDVSTPAATHYALSVLEKAGAEVPDKAACERYLSSTLTEKARTAERYSDLFALDELHACLMALSMVRAQVPDLERYLKIFDQDGHAWGLYYRLTVAEAFGHPVEDRQARIAQLDALITDRFLKGLWPTAEQHYALEAMQILGGKPTYEHWLRERTSSEFGGRRGSIRISEDAWHGIRIAKLLGKDTSQLGAALEGAEPLRPGPVGGYAPMPGCDTDAQACFLACALLGEPVAAGATRWLAERWKDGQQKGGYYGAAAADRSPRFSREDPLGRQIEDTWQAVSALRLAGMEPADREALIAWLKGVLDKRWDELSSKQIRQVLECLDLVEESSGNAPELAARLQQRFGNDPAFMIRVSKAFAVKPQLEGTAEQLKMLPDRVREAGLLMPVCVLTETFESLEAIGEGYEGTGYFLELLATLQNPDGGVRDPASQHSNIFDTMAALRMARVLPVLEARAKGKAAAPLNAPRPVGAGAETP